MTTLQIAVLFGIICMMGGAGMILRSGWEATKKDNRQIAKANRTLATPVVYEAFNADDGEVVDMVPTSNQKMIAYQTRL
jgi:hypothetical protein